MSTESPSIRRSIIATIFVSPTEPRLRAGWRLLVQVLLHVVLLALFAILAPSVFETSFDSWDGLQIVGGQLAQGLALTLSILIARRFLDRRSFVSLGLQLDKQAISEIFAGVGITFFMMALIFLVEHALGWMSLRGYAWQSEGIAQVAVNLLLSLAIFAVVGWNEELMSRGYHLQTICSGTSPTGGWVISSAVFGLLHLANPHASWLAVAGIVLAGLFLGYSYLRTGRLWLAIGLHTGWNFFEGVVFGFPVSGLPFYHLTRTQVAGPELWTGGAFGPEAGLILLPSLALGFGLVHIYARNAQRT